MDSPQSSLFERIRTLRQRHYGPSGKAPLAERLCVPLSDYERFEKSTVPPPEILVRLCEVTGEDLQWLLTGVASRGTLMISNARGRHRELLTRIAAALDARPQLARPIEAFFNLLVAEPAQTDSSGATAAAPEGRERTRCRIPILAIAQLPDRFDSDPIAGRAPRDPIAALPWAAPIDGATRFAARLLEPASNYEQQIGLRAELISTGANATDSAQALECETIDFVAPDAFGVTIESDDMSPMLRTGDVVVVSPTAQAGIGRPALCRMRDGRALCRVWLGTEGQTVHLGRLSDGSREQAPADEVCWSLEVLFRVARAA